MERTVLTFLSDWLLSANRKPLIVRGARQVGKTWLIRHLAETHDRHLIELNFEKNPEYKQYFEINDPQIILRYLEAALQCTITAEKSILFLDEIQAAPELISKLRWFYEEMPQLPVIAAGSLLEFTLSNYPYSMPVGRIGYLHVEPLSFEEFLLATGHQPLCAFIKHSTLPELLTIPLSLHDQLMRLLKDYLLVGGLPAAVVSWTKNKSLEKVGQIHYDLLATYRDDFSKYAGRLEVSRLEDVLMAIPKLLGKKFVYTHVNKNVSSTSLKQALDLLTKSRLCSRVSACAGNGIPMGAEIKNNHFKIIFLDVGLVSSLLGIKYHQFSDARDIMFINHGALAEQITGQLLRTIDPPYMEPLLYYWIREESNSTAEIDYMIQQQTTILPIEVKAGSSGHLKSLHVFMALKKRKLALRLHSDIPSMTDIHTHTQVNEMAQYQLISLPFYLLGQIHRLLEGVLST